MHRTESVILECFARNWNDWLEQFIHRFCEDTNFILRVRIHTQRKKVEKIVQVTLPIPLRINRNWQRSARQFSRHTFFSEPQIILIQPLCTIKHHQKFFGSSGINETITALAICSTLRTHRFERRAIKTIRHDRIARAVLVDIRSAMSNPLSRNKHRHRDMKFELDHFKWSRVTMPQQISHETAIFVHLLRAFAI